MRLSCAAMSCVCAAAVAASSRMLAESWFVICVAEVVQLAILALLGMLRVRGVHRKSGAALALLAEHVF